MIVSDGNDETPQDLPKFPEFPAHWWNDDGEEEPSPISVDRVGELERDLERERNENAILKERLDAKCAEYESLAKAYLELQKTVQDLQKPPMPKPPVRPVWGDPNLRGSTWN